MKDTFAKKSTVPSYFFGKLFLRSLYLVRSNNVICNIVWFVIGPNFCVLLRHTVKNNHSAFPVGSIALGMH